MKNQQALTTRDYSRGTIRTVQNSIVVPNSVPLALNMDSNIEIGSLITRLGTNRIGSQAVASALCKGLHYHRDTVGSNHKLFGVFSDGVNNDIYDMLTGTKSLQDDSNLVETNFCTFLGSTVRVNGTDPCKSWNGSAWVTTGGAFDEANMPVGKTVIEWKDRMYTWGVASQPNILYYSSIADSDTRTVVWTPDSTESGAGQVEVEQEDGGGFGTALEKVPGYLLLFKERSMKRWDGSQTYPEDLINVGAPTQKAVCRGRGMVFIANQEGLWVTNGGYPKKISKPIQDIWDAIPATNLNAIATFCDETYVYVSIGDVTINGNTLSNLVLRYNIDSDTYDIFSYYSDFKVFAWYISSSKKIILGGDSNGQAIQINTGYTDYPSIPINWSVETHDIDLGDRGKIKEISAFVAFTQGINSGQIFSRVNSNQDIDWRSIRNITMPVEEVRGFKTKGNWFNFKLAGTSNSGQAKVLGFSFPEGSISTLENVSE